MRRPPLQALLIIQLYAIFWITGIAAAVWPLPAFICALLFAVVDTRLCMGLHIILRIVQPIVLRMGLRPLLHTFQHTPPYTFVRLALAACIFMAGFFVAHTLLADPPAPAWMYDTFQGDKKRSPERLCGTVTDTRGLPDNRLRVLLTGLRPETAHTAKAALVTLRSHTSKPAPPTLETPAPGLTAWTWENPLFRPLPGQMVCLSGRLRDTAGFAGMGSTDWRLNAAAQGIYQRLWSQGAQGAPQISGTAGLSARLREDARLAMQAALQLPTQNTATAAYSALSTGGAPATGGAVSINGAGTTPKIPGNPEAPTIAALQGKAVLMALLFGDRQYLSTKTLDNFAAAALVHSLALSGQHLAVAGLLGLICVLTAARLSAGLYLRLPRALLITLAACPPALLYLWLGNAPASLLRAACMLFIMAFWLLRGQARTTLDVLITAVACITLVSPLSVFDTGLQLSALCVATIGLAMPLLRRIMPDAPTSEGQASILRRAGRMFLRILLVSLLIQTALLPLNLLLFGNAGLWFWLNVLWLPVVDVLVLPGAALGLALAVTGFDELARLVLNAAALPCEILIALLDALAARDLLQPQAYLRPHWTALPAFACLLTAWAYSIGRKPLPRQSMLLCALAATLLCTGPALRIVDRLSGQTRLEVYDVGQGAAQALYLPGALRLVIDGGGSASPRFDPGRTLLDPVLSYNDAPRLTAVLNSHPDMDHLGGLLHLARRFEVAALFDNGRDGKGERGAQWAMLRKAMNGRALVAGDVLALGDPVQGLQLHVLHPPASDFTAHTAAKLSPSLSHPLPQETIARWQGNDASLVVRLTLHGRGLALITGDIELSGLRRLVDSGQDLRAEVLIAPHHGSDQNFLPAFYMAVAPRLVVASCGRQNRYNYPGHRLRAWLAGQNIPLLRTDKDGRITVNWPTRDASARITTARTPNRATAKDTLTLTH